MPLYNNNPDDDVLSDGSRPIAGVDNSVPPSAIDPPMSEDAENRLAQLDGLNRPRPGIKRLAQASGGSLDSIHHLGNGLFLTNNGGTWYTYDNRALVWSPVSGGPSYAPGTQVYSALANSTLYFSIGGALSKYTPPGAGFGTVTLPTQYPTALYPIWALERLIYAYQNTLVVSDALNPEHVDVITGTVTLDPIASDVITGLCLWQYQALGVFRNGSTWVIETGPGLDVPNWSINRASATIGCRAHGTIVQCGVDVLFLSETGRGVYALSQAPTSEQQGVWLPISTQVRDYIRRINWVAADNARATYWNDLYILSVPLDNSPFNNFLLVYSMTLQKWQGLWCFDIGGADTAVRDFARDRTDPNWTVLMVATRDGVVSRFTYPTDRQYYDQNLDNSQVPFDSYILSRSFTFHLPSQSWAQGEPINLIRPHSARFQFLESTDPVNITAIADRAVELIKRQVQTNNYFLTLTIPGFPFDLDTDGYVVRALALLKTGICNELQFKLEGTGNWTIYQIQASAFQTMPLLAV